VNSRQATNLAASCYCCSLIGWWATGDVLRRDEAGDFWYVARKKNLIILGGSNIAPTEVEHAITVHRGVREATVVGVPDAILGQRVIGFVELADTSPRVEDVLLDLSTRLARYKMPERLHVVGQLLRNALGKVDRAKLKAIGECLNDGPAEVLSAESVTVR
jgi:acyl-coenzyme A synthetase/AMP-(fatty) acid ligase